MPKRKTAKPSSVKRTRQSKGKGRAKLPAEPSTVEQPFLSSIANVRLAVKLLREAALTPIPDLGEVSPDRFGGFGEWGPFPPYPSKTGNKSADARALGDFERRHEQIANLVAAWDREHGWSEQARSRVHAAFDWRDNLTKRIGSTSIRNYRSPDPEWDDKRLADELGYVVASSNKLEPYDGWGPPESVLGEFYENNDFGISGMYDLHVPFKFLDMVRLLVQAELVNPDKIKVDDERLQTHPFWEISPHFSSNDNARAILGPPPLHLTAAPTYRRLDRRIAAAPGLPLYTNNEFIHPLKWWQYADVILEQCLIERTRALELCSWCDKRIAAWESAFYPRIEIGPEIIEVSAKGNPTPSGRRRLTVTMAGVEPPDTARTIQKGLAEKLLLLNTGEFVGLSNTSYIGEMRTAIPLLRDYIEGGTATEWCNRATLPEPLDRANVACAYRLRPGMAGRVIDKLTQDTRET